MSNSERDPASLAALQREGLMTCQQNAAIHESILRDLKSTADALSRLEGIQIRNAAAMTPKSPRDVDFAEMRLLVLKIRDCQHHAACKACEGRFKRLLAYIEHFRTRSQ